MRAARPGSWRLLLRHRHRPVTFGRAPATALAAWASDVCKAVGAFGAVGVFGVVSTFGATAAAAEPAPRNVCFDPTVCRAATTADAPRQLVLLPTPARFALQPDGKLAWTVPVLGWVYSPISATRSECAGTVTRLSRAALRLLVEPAKSAPPPVDPVAPAATASRLAGFFVDNLCNQRIRIRITDRTSPTGFTAPASLLPAAEDPFCRTLLLMPDDKPAPKLLPVSDPGGLLCGKLTLSEEEVRRLSPLGQPLLLQAELVAEGPGNGPGASPGKVAVPTRATAEAFLMRDADTELSIISDIDDTVRISHVAYKPALVRGTFFEPFHPTPGIAELYARWQARSPSLTLHFISSSPLPLYKPLRDELMTRYPFPLATYHLKWFRVSEGDTIELLAKSPLVTKKRQIAPLLASYPHRRWALVGDTGERDPEVYTNLLVDKMLAPARLAGIFIRDVTCDAQGLHHQKFATGLAGVVASASLQAGHAARDHLPGSDQRSCRQRRFHDAFKAYRDATRSLPKPDADTAWQKWCVFYGGEEAADLAAVPTLTTPELGALAPGERPPQCWPHTQAEFSAVISATGAPNKSAAAP